MHLLIVRTPQDVTPCIFCWRASKRLQFIIGKIREVNLSWETQSIAKTLCSLNLSVYFAGWTISEVFRSVLFSNMVPCLFSLCSFLLSLSLMSHFPFSSFGEASRVSWLRGFYLLLPAFPVFLTYNLSSFSLLHTHLLSFTTFIWKASKNRSTL